MLDAELSQSMNVTYPKLKKMVTCLYDTNLSKPYTILFIQWVTLHFTFRSVLQKTVLIELHFVFLRIILKKYVIRRSSFYKQLIVIQNLAILPGHDSFLFLSSFLAVKRHKYSIRRQLSCLALCKFVCLHSAV